MTRDPTTLTEEETQRIMDIFTHACKVGVDLGLSRYAMSGILKGMAERFKNDPRPLEFYLQQSTTVN